jgi:hypothetical protein
MTLCLCFYPLPTLDGLVLPWPRRIPCRQTPHRRLSEPLAGSLVALGMRRMLMSTDNVGVLLLHVVCYIRREQRRGGQNFRLPCKFAFHGSWCSRGACEFCRNFHVRPFEVCSPSAS